VYALISVSDNASEEIVPDYSKSLPQLFVDVTSFLQSNDSYVGHRYSAETGRILQEKLGLRECEQATQALRKLGIHDESDMSNWQDRGDASPLSRIIDYFEGESHEALCIGAEWLEAKRFDAEALEAWRAYYRFMALERTRCRSRYSPQIQ
jgi:hypothetical protein